MRKLPLLFAALFMAGCGGGGTESSTPSAGEESTSVGALSVSYVKSAAKPQAVSVSGAGAAVFGISGASFTKILANPAKTLNSTYLAATTDRGGVYLLHPDGSDLHQISPGAVSNANHPAWYPGGNILYYTSLVGGPPRLFRVYSDGSGLAQLTTLSGAYYPAVSSSKVAYVEIINGFYQIRTMNLDGSGLKTISDGTTSDAYPTFSPDGQHIYFCRFQSNNTYALCQMNPDGTGISMLLQSVSSSAFETALAPNGKFIALAADGTIRIWDPTFTQTATVALPAGSADSNPSISPDSKYIAFTRENSDFTFHLMVSSVDGADVHEVTSGLFNLARPAWGPFAGTRTLVGSGGSLGTSASGLLLGQVGDNVTSVLTFTATTAASTQIIPQPGNTNATNSIFKITGDSITSVRYLNNLFELPTVVIPGSTASATGFFVSVNLATGRVALVVPFAKATRVQSASGLVYKGEFLGVWDGSGHNKAPNGTHTLKL